MHNPKATILTISQFTFLLILIASCGSPDGACESKNFIAGENHYWCADETENSCDICVSDECAFSKGKSCAELGYTENSSSGSGNKHNPAGRTVPGANGKFANNTGSTGGSTIGGINCSNGYQGPEFDIQIDAQCQTAYAYACSGSQAGVDAACAIYKTYQAQNSSIPNCPYCK